MIKSTTHVRHGRGSVRAYMYGPVDLPEFVRQAFDATEIERFEFGPRSFHVEMQIGDSTLVIEAGALPPDVKPGLARFTCTLKTSTQFSNGRSSLEPGRLPR